MPRLKAPEFERIFLEDFVNDGSVELIGDASFSHNRSSVRAAVFPFWFDWFMDRITVKSSSEESTIQVDGCYKSEAFLLIVNQYLADHNLLLAKVHSLSPKKLFDLVPYKLKGKLYRER